jgi:starch-binding outer membrane protein, SusD/RagB family
MTTRIQRTGLALAGALLLGGCDLDRTDPNLTNEQDVITTERGLREFGIGLQARWGNDLVNPVYITGLVTNEIGAIPQAFESYRLVDAGQPVDNNLGPSTETWAGMYRVVGDANLLLASVPQAAVEPAMASGLIALAQLFKGMAFGALLQTYERIPLDVGLHNEHPVFATRAEGLAEVLRLLNAARTQLQTTPPSAAFTSQVLAPGFNLPATIDAMIARYALIVGDLDAAFAAAERVPLDILSEFRFSPTDPNPLRTMFIGSGNAFAMRPKQRFRVQAQPGDQRVAFWITSANITGATEPLDQFNRYFATDHPFPAYLPDEMRLIRAEVYARRNDLPAALALVNQVRTPCSSPLNEPVACLPALTIADVPTQQTMLDAILREREYELYLQGVRWSDLRRFGRPVKYAFMMVSRPECNRNNNAPADVCQPQTTP